VQGVEKASHAQEEAKEQFKSALEQFSAVVNFDGGVLQQKYDQLSSELKNSESKAEEVQEQINSVEDVAKALFNEWETELQQYSNKNMQKISKQNLTETRQRYAKLISAMKRVEQKILKHNLNAQAIASLQSELVSVESSVASLISEMEVSIAEADTFIHAMSQK